MHARLFTFLDILDRK